VKRSHDDSVGEVNLTTSNGTIRNNSKRNNRTKSNSNSNKVSAKSEETRSKPSASKCRVCDGKHATKDCHYTSKNPPAGWSGRPKTWRKIIKNQSKRDRLYSLTATVSRYSKNFNLSRNDWLVDSGSGNYICNSLGSFDSIKPLSESIRVANRSSMSIIRQGFVRLLCKHPNRASPSLLQLKDVYFIPKCTVNLVSTSQLS